MTSEATDSGISPGIRFSNGQEGEITCFRCGKCCQRYQVKLDVDEAQIIADYLELTKADFLERYADSRWHLDGVLLRQRYGSCVFLAREGRGKTRCLINVVKPSTCQAWKSSLHRRECREGLLQYWGLFVTALGHLTGPPKKLEKFYAFLESLKQL